jgi:hypothetical protein
MLLAPPIEANRWAALYSTKHFVKRQKMSIDKAKVKVDDEESSLKERGREGEREREMTMNLCK